MNVDTKRHIDSARQVLVGVVPNPTSQIDQITNALIYKFMDDMDQASIKAGGDPAFFVDDLEKYAWTRLMDPRMGNQERMNLYGEALIKFSQAKQLPELFRGIFKSAFLPYRSPETLGLFLKEIDYFDYSHPEELGNAYEYLLSIMSSQGDAGQFRTPRHIIDFIVDVVNPTKDDKVLDPACGTGGFLVSSYKHILEQHDGKNDLRKKEKSLTPDERKKLMANFEGYDIDPTMVRISQVNMYLHQFKNPKIFQYDALSSDERWNDKFDVILANPPFMSPKGGIRPHNKFSITSSRSEVLFVDYIMNHLRPKGRAGVIVPEGIVFANSNKELRKNLVEDGLYAVVSLPSGVFNPYAGVKTSILFFDNELAKQSQYILFIKILNDGFDLGAQRRPRPDLPNDLFGQGGAVDVLRAQRIAIETGNKNGLVLENSRFAWVVKKDQIVATGDYNLSGDRYRVATDYTNAKWPMVDFGDVVSTITPPVKIEKNNFGKKGNFPIIDQSQEEIAGWTDDEGSLVKFEKPVVIFGDHTCAIKYTEKPFAQGADGIKILLTNDQLVPKFLYYILKTKPVKSDGYQRHFAKLKRYEIPLPPLEIQEQIVAELDGYASIIAGARQIAQNWKPKIDIDPKWEKVKLGEVCEIGSSKRVFESEWKTEGVPFYRAREIVKLANNGFVENKLFISEEMFSEYSKKYGYPKEGDIMVTGVGTLGICYLVSKNDKFYFKDGNIIWLKNFTNNIDSRFVRYLFENSFVKDQISANATGGTVGTYTIIGAKNTIIPLPPLAIQKQIVEKIEAERALVESSKKLIEIYEQKTKEVIAKLWAE